MKFLWPVLFLFSFLFSEEKRSKYFIALKPNEGTPFPSFERYIPLLPPPGKFYADPFLFMHEGVDYLFFEDYNYQKGVISYVTLGPDGIPSKPQLALEEKVHLSFPFVFSDEGSIYLLPETYQKRRVSLYKATSFPQEWKWERTLIQGDFFSDPILFKHGGYYWLFVSIEKDRLQIYYAKDLSSSFSPHPINWTYRIGRNAGPIFFFEGRMIRPTMDCKSRYGESILFKEILLLTKSQFIEKDIACIQPTWAPGLVGTHTYGQNERYIVYDGERLVSAEEDPLYSSSD